MAVVGGDKSGDDEEDQLIASSRAVGSRGAGPQPSRIGAADDGVPNGVAEEGRDVERGSLEVEPPEGQKVYTKRGQKWLYQVWPGENRFFFGGVCMTGGSDECWAPNCCVWTCILVPSTVYFVWVFPHLWSRGAYALPAATLAVFLSTSGLLCATCCTDPGIIPRREVILATGSAAKLEEVLGYDVLGGCHGPSDAQPQIPQRLSAKGYRWCRTCHIIRPPRASHCPDCGNCCLRYDHHCPFVNNCVGQRNYHFFFGFITSVLVLAVMVLPSIAMYFSALSHEKGLQQMTKLSSGLRVVFYAMIGGSCLIILATLLSCVLWVYHVFLIGTKRTTKEYRKSIENIDEEPTLCAERGPQLFSPWDLVDPQDLRRAPTASRGPEG